MIDKIIGELEELNKDNIRVSKLEGNTEIKKIAHTCRADEDKKAIEIVKRYKNDGWINVKGRLRSEEEWQLGDRVFHKNLEQYGSIIAWDEFSDDSCFVKFDKDEFDYVEEKCVSFNQLIFQPENKQPVVLSKPIFKHMIGGETAIFLCECGFRIKHKCEGFEDDSFKFCSNCGRKLDWSEEEDSASE